MICFWLELRRWSSAWVLKICGVPAYDRQDVGVLKRVIKAIFSVTGVPSLTYLTSGGCGQYIKINLQSVWVLISLENAPHSTILGRFPFGQKLRKFRFGVKRKTFFRLARLENFQIKWNCSDGSPVFPVGTSRLVSRVPIASPRWSLPVPGPR